MPLDKVTVVQFHSCPPSVCPTRWTMSYLMWGGRPSVPWVTYLYQCFLAARVTYPYSYICSVKADISHYTCKPWVLIEGDFKVVTTGAHSSSYTEYNHLYGLHLRVYHIPKLVWPYCQHMEPLTNAYSYYTGNHSACTAPLQFVLEYY